MAGVTRAVHLRKEHWDVRIDRSGKWGNPFPVGNGRPRSEAIRLFEVFCRASPTFMKMIKAELKGKVLGCWCKPKPCHGDVLARIAEE